MRARKYNKRVEIWQTSNVSDGFGGYTNTSSQVGTSWAKIEPMKNDRKSEEVGVETLLNTIIVTMRKRNDLTINPLNMYLRYRSTNYEIQGVVNIGFEDRDLQIIAIKDSVKSAN